MKRRPWLTLVVLVLIGINAATFVRQARSIRFDDEIAAVLDSDVAPYTGVTFEVPPVRVAVLVVDDPPLARVVADPETIIALAPKTSPPR